VLRSGDLALLGAHGQDRSKVLARPKIYFAQPFGVVGEEQAVAANYRVNDHVRGTLEAYRPSRTGGLDFVSRRRQYAGAQERYTGTRHNNP
jgi:hypothetical protein